MFKVLSRLLFHLYAHFFNLFLFSHLSSPRCSSYHLELKTCPGYGGADHGGPAGWTRLHFSWGPTAPFSYLVARWGQNQRTRGGWSSRRRGRRSEFEAACFWRQGPGEDSTQMPGPHPPEGPHHTAAQGGGGASQCHLWVAFNCFSEKQSKVFSPIYFSVQIQDF